jgi:DNA-directed RNA polymerase subunit alpha
MIELENPQIEPVEEVGTYAKYEAGPLQAGYGVTLGNALRRVLLSSLEGAAVTSIQIRDVYQEFSTIPGVKEDVTQIVLNVKKLRLKSFATHPVQLRLIKSGAGAVTAGDIAESADVEIVNPELGLMTLDTDDVTIEVDLTVEKGVGYLGAERAEALPIGVIAVDAIFTPVRKVNYWVESMRVGQMTNYDKLTIEIETDGTITPEEALSRSAEILVNQFRPFITIGIASAQVDRAASAGESSAESRARDWRSTRTSRCPCCAMSASRRPRRRPRRSAVGSNGRSASPSGATCRLAARSSPSSRTSRSS